MPVPRSGESRKAYIKRCMADSTELALHPDEKQRFAACQAYWTREQKSMTFDELIKAIQERTTTTRWGVGIASHYLKSIMPGLPPGLLDGEEWANAMKHAEGMLTWCEAVTDSDTIAKSFDESTDIPAGYRATFDATLTSKRQDRDGDVLEPMGFEVDPAMALLWQHLVLQPVGKHFRVLTKSDDRIRSRFGIVDTPLGSDTATLVQADVLRMSHGFKPYEYEPLAEKDGVTSASGMPTRWHMLKGEIREASVVSVPSNVDGVIEAFASRKLHTPLIKGWAKMFYDARPVQVPGVDLGAKASGDNGDGNGNLPGDSEKAGAVIRASNLSLVKSARDNLDKVIASAGGGGKQDEPEARAEKNAAELVQAATAAEVKKYMSDDLEGSFEWVRDKLRRTAADYLRARGVSISYDDWTHLIATFADVAIVGISHGADDTCYRIAYELADDGPQWSGDPVEVEIKPQVLEVAKVAAGIRTVEACVAEICAKAVLMEPAEAKQTLESALRSVGATAASFSDTKELAELTV